MRNEPKCGIENAVGIIGRFQPLHLGGAALLQYAFANYDYVRIGLGSANRGTSSFPYNARNPFSIAHTKDMLNAYIKDAQHRNEIVTKPYDIIGVNDHFGKVDETGKSLWANEVKEKFNGIQSILSGNPYVIELLKSDFRVEDPFLKIIDTPNVRASDVRYAIATNQNWQALLPHAVTHYMISHDLDVYLKEAFGEQIAKEKPKQKDSLCEEKENIVRVSAEN
jgi:nicotinamide mononucleotide adenylyltransferase